MYATNEQQESGGAIDDAAAARVIDVLRSELMAGAYPVGAAIRERAIVERFGVSRTPAREAIAHLVAIGLLDKVRNRSARVVGPSLTAIKEAYVIRQQLEPYAAELTANSGFFDAPEHRAELERLWTEVMGERSAPGWDEAHQDFHMLLVAGSGIARLERLIHDLRAESRGYIHFVLVDDQFANRAHAQHDQMYQLALRGDGKALNTLLRRHLSHTVEQISRVAATEQLLRAQGSTTIQAR